MAENDQNNDEYKFEEFDSPRGESMGDLDLGTGSGNPGGKKPSSEKKDVKRNALIVVVIVIVAMVMYKLVGNYMSGRNQQLVKPTMPPVTQLTPKTVPIDIPTTVKPQVVEQPESANFENKVIETELKQKISALELSQDNMKTQVNTLGNQIGVINTNVENLNAQISKLNQVIVNLSNQVTKQSYEMSRLIVKNKPKSVSHVMKRHAQPIVYYIQAVIPGRAWLIGSNGSTLTVREGSRITGYGVVKLIDSLQGRVLTSSGRAIKFSQEDS